MLLPTNEEAQGMSLDGSKKNNKILKGVWEKITLTECSNEYPDLIEFKGAGIYTGSRNSGEFTIWDAGSYEITSGNSIKISTANDAEINYTFSIDKDKLTFIDGNDCKFIYEKR
jgi:hypothetical protein